MKKSLLYFASILLFSACSSYKNISYFQDIDKILEANNHTIESEEREKVIKPEDELSIIVSSVDPKTAAPFNLPAVVAQSGGNMQLSTTPNLQTYVVNSAGSVTIPTLGKMQLAELTLEEAEHFLETKLKPYLKDPIVNIRFLNFKISVLGEVRNPGRHYFNDQTPNVLDALAAANDLTIYGKRDNILLIRRENGQKIFHRFDLTKSDMFQSPYFYLQQNDILYVESNIERQKDAEMSQNKQYNFSIVATAISSTIGVASLIIALVLRNK